MAGRSSQADTRGSNFFSNFVSGKSRDFHSAKSAYSILPFSASGGSTVESGGFKYHVFTTSGALVVESKSNDIYYAVVGGGGGGGNQHSAGGGAGGFRTNHPGSSPGGPGTSAEASYPVSPGTYNIVIGSGGLGAPAGPNKNAPAGGYSSFNTGGTNGGAVIRSEGGGDGAGWNSSTQPSGTPGLGGVGGSGGGSSYDRPNTTRAQAGYVGGDPTTPTPIQGYPGGAYAGSVAHVGGGGGGAGGAGGDATWGGGGDPAANGVAGNGGIGRANPALPGPIFTPIMPAPWVSAVAPQGYFAGGGGGAGYVPRSPANTSGTGGAGGGAPGYPTAPDVAGTGPAAEANTGGGGGAGNTNVVGGGAGGDGVVIIWYPTAA